MPKAKNNNPKDLIQKMVFEERKEYAEEEIQKTLDKYEVALQPQLNATNQKIEAVLSVLDLRRLKKDAEQKKQQGAEPN